MAEKQKPGKKIKPIFIFGLGVLLVVALILIPWSDLALRIGFDPFRINTPSGLQVNCLVGKCTVYLDGQKKGETPLELLDITPGEHTVKLEKLSKSKDFYPTVTKKVNFLRGTNIYIEWELGPSEIFSQGHILSYKSRTHGTEPVLSINSGQKDIKVAIDGINVGDVPYLADKDTLKEGPHKITLSKTGYLSREVEVDIDFSYISQLDVELMALPVNY